MPLVMTRAFFRARGRAARPVAGGPGGPGAALAPGVHHEHGVAERGQQRVLGGQAATAAVADELHYRGRGPVRSGGPQVPGPYPVAFRPGEFGVVHLDRRVDFGLVPGQRGRASQCAGLGQALLPPRVEVRRLRGFRPVYAQLVHWQVKPGHWSLQPVKVAESSPTIFLVAADPEARGDQWRRVWGAYGNRGPTAPRGSAGPRGDDPARRPGDGTHGDGMYAEGADGSRQAARWLLRLSGVFGL